MHTGYTKTIAMVKAIEEKVTGVLSKEYISTLIIKAAINVLARNFITYSILTEIYAFFGIGAYFVML
ncbi:MAG: hypothetical protein HUJ98_10440 [Bacteroidaceae bacterium]|nr:hypothetical protein [Bacteroidaceae bacterium]